jgi:hypothetical protein
MTSHPFFDALAYPWHRPEAEEFHSALAATVPVGMVGILFPASGGDLINLNQQQAPLYVWRDVLDQLTIIRGLKALCEWCKANADYHNNKSFQDAVRRVFAAAFLPPRQVLVNDATQLLMFDRQLLWADLDRLRTSTDRTRMLVVGGDRKSGKSHAHNLFELAASERGKAEVVYLTRDLVTNDREVVGALADRIGVEIDIPSAETPTESIASSTSSTTVPAWYKVAINKMLGAARQSQTEWWIVMDDLGCDENGAMWLDKTVRMFFMQFGLTFVDPLCRKWFRLMLIGLPPEGRTRWDQNAYVERALSERDITVGNVSEAFQEAARAKEKALSPQAADELAQATFAAAKRDYDKAVAAAAAKQIPGLDPPSWLQCLHDRTADALKAL